MTKKQLPKEKENRHIIREDVRFGLFKGKVKKELEYIRANLEEGTKFGIEIGNLIDELQEIKDYIEKELNGKYTDIFIIPKEGGDWDYRDHFFDIELGRYESDTEYYKRKSELRKEDKRRNSQRLEKEAKELLRLQRKFRINDK